jgi:hypothetical protein
MADITMDSPVGALWQERPAGTAALIACSALRRAGIRTVVRLTQCTLEQILRLDGAGPKSLDAIRAALADHGLALKGEMPDSAAGCCPPEGSPAATALGGRGLTAAKELSPHAPAAAAAPGFPPPGAGKAPGAVSPPLDGTRGTSLPSDSAGVSFPPASPADQNGGTVELAPGRVAPDEDVPPSSRPGSSSPPRVGRCGEDAGPLSLTACDDGPAPTSAQADIPGFASAARERLPGGGLRDSAAGELPAQDPPRVLPDETAPSGPGTRGGSTITVRCRVCGTFPYASAEEGDKRAERHTRVTGHATTVEVRGA